MTHRQFFCIKCGCDWMTVLPDIDTCQMCYEKMTPDVLNSTALLIAQQIKEMYVNDPTQMATDVDCTTC